MDKKNNIYNFIKEFIKILFERIHSQAGRANIGMGILILLVITIVLFQPIAAYILQFFQSLFNTFLLFNSKDTIPIADNPDTLLALIICLLFLLAEIVFCSLLIHWSDSKKAELLKGQETNVPQITPMF